MVDVKTSNVKLVERARRIYKTLLPSSLLSDVQINNLIASCDGSVKTALVVGRCGCTVIEAQSHLKSAGGALKKVWEAHPDVVMASEDYRRQSSLVLCVDAGGTRCTAVIAGETDILARAEAGPCNLYVSFSTFEGL